VRRRYALVLASGYGALFGAVTAAGNFGYDLTTSGVTLWIAAPAVGFLAERWWVVLATIGVLAGHAIGWNSAEHDGDPALWSPFVVTQFLVVGGPLVLGAFASVLCRERERPSVGGPA
jgi:hypothetical protein